MPSVFPTNFDTFVNPIAVDLTTNPPHASQHGNANNAIEAIEHYLGTDSSTLTTTITGRIKALETSTRSLPWAAVSGKPTDFTGYGLITELNGRLAAKQDLLVSGVNIKTINGVPVLGAGDITITGGGGGGGGGASTWGSITGKPSTLAGYGITDAFTKAEITVSLAAKQDTLVSGTSIKTINGNSILGTGDLVIAGGGGGGTVATDWGSLANKPTTIGGFGITDAYTKTQTDTLLAAKQGTLVSGTSIKTINGNSILGNGDLTIASGGAWSSITGKPTTVAGYGITDAYTKAEVTAELAKKADTVHSHTTAQVTGLDTALAGKAPTVHTHAIADVTGLQATLNGKAPLTGVGTSGTWPINISGDADTVSGYKIVFMTEAAFQALGTKDPKTIYLRS